MEKSLTKYQPDPKPHLFGGTCDQMSTWPAVVSYLARRCLCWGEYVWPKVSLTQSLTKCQPVPKFYPVGYIWPKASLTWSLTWRGLCLTRCQPDLKLFHPCPQDVSAWWYVWPKVSLTRSLTKCQPDPKPHPWGYIWPKVNLTWRSDKNVNLTWSLICWGSIWLSVKRLCENLNTFCILGLAPQSLFYERSTRSHQ